MKRTAWIITGASTAAALAFIVGRHSAPAPDVQVQERVVYRERVVTVTATQAERVRNVVVYRDRVTKPDGTVTEREVERTHAVDVERVQVQQVAAVTAASDTVRRVDASHPAPTWRVSALAGAPMQLPPGPVLVGVHLQRRLWGPVSAGAWALAPVSPGAPVMAGVSLGVEW